MASDATGCAAAATRIGDRTRRDIVARTLHQPYSVSALAANYAMSFAAVQKHVAVLEKAGLVTKERKGREQHVRTQIETIQRAQALLDQFEALWRDRFTTFGEVLAEHTQGESR